MVLTAGLAAGSWFVSTEEVDPAATEPSAYDLFLWLFVMAAVAGAVVLCIAAEIVVRLVRRRDRRSA